MVLLKDKKGTTLSDNLLVGLITIIVLLIVLFIIFMVQASYGKICHNSDFTITEKIIDITPNFLDKSVTNLFEKSLAGKSIGDRMDNRAAKITNLLGYGRTGTQSFCLFFYDLGVGLLAGLWIWILYLIYFYENVLNLKLIKTRASKNPWLRAIGSSAYKILAIGLAYAVIMQIPFLNAAIDIILFDFFANGFWFDVVVRSFLIAFYLGVGPTAYSEYKRYKMKRAYQYAVLRKKYQAKANKTWFEN